MKQNRSSDKTQIIMVAVLLGAGILALVALLAFALRGDILQLATPATPTQFFPTPDCGSATLVLGSTTFQMQVIQLGADGSVSVPPNGTGIAYWIEGTDLQYIFLLSSSPENSSLVSSLPAGSLAKAIWPSCNSMTFSLSAPQPGSFELTYLPEQSTASIAVFVQTDASGNGLVVGGALTEEQISTFNTPASNGTEVQAEIGLLETITSADGATITLNISIYNYGTSTITVSASDISLTSAGAAPLEMMDSKPRLPEKIDAAETKTFSFTFPRPSTPTATLKIFTVEYDIE
ncbi:MAG: hypothetical protein ABI621_19480 [Chloroflexota bacterium]